MKHTAHIPHRWILTLAIFVAGLEVYGVPPERPPQHCAARLFQVATRTPRPMTRREALQIGATAVVGVSAVLGYRYWNRPAELLFLHDGSAAMALPGMVKSSDRVLFYALAKGPVDASVLAAHLEGLGVQPARSRTLVETIRAEGMQTAEDSLAMNFLTAARPLFSKAWLADGFVSLFSYEPAFAAGFENKRRILNEWARVHDDFAEWRSHIGEFKTKLVPWASTRKASLDEKSGARFLRVLTRIWHEQALGARRTSEVVVAAELLRCLDIPDPAPCIDAARDRLAADRDNRVLEEAVRILSEVNESKQRTIIVLPASVVPRFTEEIKKHWGMEVTGR